MHRPVPPHLTRTRSLRFDKQSLAQIGLAVVIVFVVASAFHAF